jgi:hypothetical protein
MLTTVLFMALAALAACSVILLGFELLTRRRGAL